MDRERYSRQIILEGFGEEAQARLSVSRVLVIGAGGLGCPVLQYLAAMGVGCIGIADDDVIDLSNLHRQVLFGTQDIGRLKTEIADSKLKQMNPGIKIQLYSLRINRNNIISILKEYDIIIDGTDNFESRYLINDACALLGKPLVFAAISGYEGQLAIFNIADDSGQKTNYRDLFPVPPKAGEIPNCAENGVLGVLPGIIGTMAAAEVIKLVSGIGQPLINKILHYNLLNQEQYIMNISPAQDYVLPATENDLLEHENYCGTTQGYIEIDAPEMFKLRKEQSALIIDVRERHEFPILDKQIYKQVPMSEFAVFLKSDIAQTHIVLLCQHGIRSVAAAELLHEKYNNTKKIYSVKGGIAKWKNHF
jgi:adenylyltransferase/sulfurtransferase